MTVWQEKLDHVAILPCESTFSVTTVTKLGWTDIKYTGESMYKNFQISETVHKQIVALVHEPQVLPYDSYYAILLIHNLTCI